MVTPIIKSMQSFFNLTFVKLYLTFQITTRAILSIYAIGQQQINIKELGVIFTAGIINDLISLCYALPVILLLAITLYKLFGKYKTLYLMLCTIGYFLTTIILLFIAIAELVFWDEFGTKFNFIAVDYLIYTHEIIGTIRESLPIAWIISSIVIAAIVITYLVTKPTFKKAKFLNIKNYSVYTAISFTLALLAFKFYDPEKTTLSTNKYAEELGKNGSYEFFSAYYNNSLDYHKFYSVIDEKRALNIVKNKLLQANQQFLDESSIRRITTPSAKTTKPSEAVNVIFITIESLSSSFMGKFGNSENITPYLDQLADESLFFTNLYAAGTRTVRGLEAITLSVPPTPGSSIIRRPNNHSLFNIASVFKQQGYEIDFIFGGYSYFDNLKNYFEGNGYNNIDRSTLKTNEISFSNVWGVADEDILKKALEIADQHYWAKQPFFSLIMTTSNHRPYTFPAGRIDRPSGSGRAAAVKYTDYAVGKFIEEAKKRPWFDNTIFVITADHCATGSGKTALPVHKYHIPLMIYAPKIVRNKVINNLASQIDIAPTIFGLLNFTYESKFFGSDILNFPANRAFISTYQLLGYMKEGQLIILAPNAKPKSYKLALEEKIEIDSLPELTEEAISFYQTAYDFYVQGKMGENMQ